MPVLSEPVESGTPESEDSAANTTTDPPTADFSVNPRVPSPGKEATLLGRASNDPDGDIREYEWTIEYGGEYTLTTIEYGVEVGFVWEEPGAYEVTLEVENDNFDRDTKSKTVEIANKPPEPLIGVTPDEIFPGTTVTLDARLSSDPDGQIQSYDWRITEQYTDEGPAQLSGETVEYEFAEAGPYEVELITTDDRGKTARTTQRIPVQSRPPIAEFQIETDTPTQYEAVSLDASESRDPDGEVVAYDWRIAGPSEDTSYSGERIQHTFQRPGEHEVQLRVEDNQKKTDSIIKTVDIREGERDTTTTTATTTSEETTTETTAAAGSTTEKTTTTETGATTQQTAEQTTFGSTTTETTPTEEAEGSDSDDQSLELLAILGGTGLSILGLIGYGLLRTRPTEGEDPYDDSGPGAPTVGSDSPGDGGAGATPATESTETAPPSESTTNPSSTTASESIDTQSQTQTQGPLAEAQTLLDSAMEQPFADIEETEEQLLQAHTALARAVEADTATDTETETEKNDKTPEQTLEQIEAQVEALPEIEDILAPARELSPEERLQLDREAEASLRAQRARYDDAIETAEAVEFPVEGLETERSRVVDALGEVRSHPSEDKLLRGIETTIEDYGRVPTVAEVTDHRETGEHITESAYDEIFDGWGEALRATPAPVESLLEDEVERVAADIGSPPTKEEFDEESDWAVSVVTAYYGGWDTALESVFDDAQLTTAGGETVPDTSPSRDKYIEEIQRIAASTGSVIKASEFNDKSDYSSHEIIQKFGDWVTALERAGVDRRKRLLKELQRVGEHLGRRPSTTDMNEHGDVSATMYTDHFGSFSAAVEEAFDAEDFEDTTASSDEPEAYAVLKTLPEEGRLDQPIAVKAMWVESNPGKKKDASVRMEDLAGGKAWLNVWSVHDIGVDWTEGDWYVLEEARTRAWENSDGETERALSSTRDLTVIHVGDERPDGETVDTDVQQPNQRRDTSDSHDGDTTTSGAGEESKQSAGHSDDEDSILDELMGEFNES